MAPKQAPAGPPPTAPQAAPPRYTSYPSLDHHQKTSLAERSPPSPMPTAAPTARVPTPELEHVTTGLANVTLDEPIIPLGPPYWEGNPERVPSPAEISASVQLSSAAFAGAGSWLAIVATWAAQMAGTNAGRESIAQKFRSKPWMLRFMEEHQSHFASNQSGSRTTTQFHVGIQLVPLIREKAFAEMGGPYPLARIVAAVNWADAILADGFCYAILAPATIGQERMTEELLAYPSARDVSAWFSHHGVPFPGAFYAHKHPFADLVHIAFTKKPGYTLMSLPRDPGPGPHIPPDWRIGGLEAAPAVGAEPTKDREVRVVIVLNRAVTTRVNCDAIKPIAALAAVWNSVRLLSVECELAGAVDTGSSVTLGLSSPAAVKNLPVVTNPKGGTMYGAPTAATVLLCDSVAMISGATTGVGATTATVRIPTERVDVELSSHTVANFRPRPDLWLSFSPLGATHARLVITLLVSHGATITHTQEQVF